jgi:hypothetical protein
MIWTEPESAAFSDSWAAPTIAQLGCPIISTAVCRLAAQLTQAPLVLSEEEGTRAVLAADLSRLQTLLAGRRAACTCSP